uniref:FBA_2 domain-containing protein n=1 Tax=Caenorhabditis tropicalis TaxID=1561998 RepID=A0A1I7TNY5_9PELO
MAVECLRIPDQIEPKCPKVWGFCGRSLEKITVLFQEGSMMAKAIWKRSFNEWPLERLYTKVNIFLVSSGNASVERPLTTVTTKYTI